MQVVLNGKKVEAAENITILELARSEGIRIPTLCHDEELNPYGSCWVCAVQVKGHKGFVTSCGTKVTPGMEITTDSEEIHSARKMALELLISDHYADCEAPCKIACPDHVDVQTYVSLIANGKFHEAVKVIKDTLPMPLSIGRICPAFCEAECRRQIVEDPIAIRQLKRFAADEDLGDVWQYTPEIKAPNGKKVAVIGGGPSGLTCGYYLSFEGFEVDLFEAEEAPGGWLRYGIPEYRLPKDILDAEIELMESGGMKIHTGKALGRDFSLAELSSKYDAVYLALGAQNAVPMPVKGSDLKGCYLGVDFLKEHAKGNTAELGKKLAVVGGGNTAIDCARTAIRLGVEVSIIYRRTKKEMPAEDFEIKAAELEGVNFHFLSNPVEYLGEEGHLKQVRIERMKLGEPDKSGRRRPEPTGDFFIEEFDSIIAAISQVPEVGLFARAENEVEGKQLPISRWQTAIVDEENMYTGIANVFAGGDFQRGAATAIEAIADGRKASEAIQSYLLTGKLPQPGFVFNSQKAKKVQDVSPEEYKGYELVARAEMHEIMMEDAKNSFQEVELGFSWPQAKREATRCIECGCQVNETCSLRDYCSEYKVDMDHFLGSISKHPIDYDHPFILRDTNKCINCGRCLRTCAEIQGANVLGFIYRGFAAVTGPEFGESLTETDCLCCGKCVDVCPTGALVERNLLYKLNPSDKDKVLQNCGLCGVACEIQTELQAREVTRITTPVGKPGFNGQNLCFKGRFGWQSRDDKLQKPLLRKNGIYDEIDWKEALQILQTRLKPTDKVSIEITPHVTLEEMLIAKRIAKTLGTPLSADPAYFAFSDAYLDPRPREDAFGLMADYEELVVVGELNRTLLSLIRLEQRKGKKLSLVSYPQGTPFSKFGDAVHKDLSELAYHKGQLYIYNQNRISETLAAGIWGKAGKGGQVLCTSDYMNHSGFLQMAPAKVSAEAVDLALCFGKLPVSQAAYKVAISTFKPDGCDADLILPGTDFLEIEGHALGDRGKISRFANPTRSSITCELLRLFYMLKWISPATADMPYWNQIATEKLELWSQSKPAGFTQLSSWDLADKTRASDAPFEGFMESLYKLRRNRVRF